MNMATIAACKSSSGFLVRSFFERVYACCNCARAPSKPSPMLLHHHNVFRISSSISGQPIRYSNASSASQPPQLRLNPAPVKRTCAITYRRPPWRSAPCERILSLLVIETSPVISGLLGACCAASRGACSSPSVRSSPGQDKFEFAAIATASACARASVALLASPLATTEAALSTSQCHFPPQKRTDNSQLPTAAHSVVRNEPRSRVVNH